MQALGFRLDVRSIHDRVSLLLSLVQANKLLALMSTSLLKLPVKSHTDCFLQLSRKIAGVHQEHPRCAPSSSVRHASYCVCSTQSYVEFSRAQSVHGLHATLHLSKQHCASCFRLSVNMAPSLVRLLVLALHCDAIVVCTQHAVTELSRSA